MRRSAAGLMLGGFLAAAIGALAVQQQCGDCPALKPLPEGGLGCVFEADAVYDIQVCTTTPASVIVLFRSVCVLTRCGLYAVPRQRVRVRVRLERGPRGGAGRGAERDWRLRPLAAV